MGKELSFRQKQAVENYLSNGGNKDKAALDAGYSHRQCARLVFNNPKVVKEIERRKEQIMKKYELDAEWVIQRMARLADAPTVLAKYMQVREDGTISWDFTGASKEDLWVIRNVMTKISYDEEGNARVTEFKVDTADVLAALNSLAKVMGIVVDKNEISGPNGKPVQVDVSNHEVARRLAFILAQGVKEIDNGDTGSSSQHSE